MRALLLKTQAEWLPKAVLAQDGWVRGFPNCRRLLLGREQLSSPCDQFDSPKTLVIA